MRSIWATLFCCLFLLSCKDKNSSTSTSAAEETTPVFTELSSEKTRLDFSNLLTLDDRFDVFRYRNYYNGGGVAIGDVNNDGLSDIYFTANCAPNKLFLNKGNLVFEDISETSRTGGTQAWSTGVAMADVNGDGWLDIYVCNSGDIEGDNRNNELFINNGDLTFTEKGEEFGLADKGFSTHAAFFDYDKDGDLDCYLLNNSFRPISTLGFRNYRNTRDEMGGDKLFRNDNNHFTDVSEAAGIYGSVIGFGLGVTVGDVDLDGWQDIYISNDFYERDYLYVNQKNGAFKESLPEQMGHCSYFSMGADMADLNNDLFPEIFVTDMLPEGLARIKQTTQFTGNDEYNTMVRNGFHHQFMRNTLQLNNGNSTFSEIAQALGVHATDWSWGALLADFDNNGHKDIFVCNGVYKDVTDQDFVNFMANDENIKAAESGKKIDFKAFVDKMPSTKLPNYLFANSGNLHFENQTENWGLAKPTHSNGAAYGDLDNDGDLELVVSNVNDKAMLYKNNTSELGKNHFLKLKLKGESKNPFANGAKIVVYAGRQKFYYEHMPVRGFQSSMDYVATIGIGAAQRADSIVVLSILDKLIRLENVPAGQLVTVDFSEGTLVKSDFFLQPKSPQSALFTQTNSLFPKGNPVHVENEFIDFDRDKLLYHKSSTEGPKMAMADVNGDGYEDFYFCGAHGSAGQLFLFNVASQQFQVQNIPAFDADKNFEDVDAAWEDVDGDGDLDLYVASGGSEFLYDNEWLQDRLYLNQSKGKKIGFIRGETNLPRLKRVASCVEALDFDGDKDLDFFVGNRMDPAGYGIPTTSFLLENDGAGRFTEVSGAKAPTLKNIGMVTAAYVSDLNADAQPDLVLAGDWMPVTVLFNKNGKFPKEAAVTIPNSEGMWRSLLVEDFDGDGRRDILAGNIGFNSRFKGSIEKPMRLYVKDFDSNGSVEQIFCMTENGSNMPITLKSDLKKVYPAVNKKYNDFKSYTDQSIEQIFGEKLTNAVVLECKQFASVIFYQNPKGWSAEPLPMEAQFSPVNVALFEDFNGDGKSDLLLGGNFFGAKPEVGRYDASFGALLLGDGAGKFEFYPNKKSGLMVRGEVRDLQFFQLKNGRKALFIAKNNAPLETWFVK